MRPPIIVLVLSLACVQAHHYAYVEYLDDTPESTDFNLDTILKSDELTKNFIDCVLDKGNCAPEVETLKKDIIDAFHNGCAKCDKEHKENVRKVLYHLVTNRPNWWHELENKFDPKRDHKDMYSDFLEKEGYIR